VCGSKYYTTELIKEATHYIMISFFDSYMDYQQRRIFLQQAAAAVVCAAGVAAVIYAQSLESESESEEFELDETTVELAQSVTRVIFPNFRSA